MPRELEALERQGDAAVCGFVICGDRNRDIEREIKKRVDMRRARSALFDR